MKRYVLVKEGDYRGNVFVDFQEMVNNANVADRDTEQVGFYSRMDYSFRLMKNRSSMNPDYPLAVASYIVDPLQRDQDPKQYRPVDMEKMMSALDSGRDFVMFGLVTGVNVLPENDLITGSFYMTRDAAGQLVDLDTGKRLCDIDPMYSNVAMVTALFGLIKLGDTPVYYLICDPNLLKPNGGYDFYDDERDVVYKLISDHDGTIKENVFGPTFNKEATLVGKYNVFVTGDKLTLDLFGSNKTIFAAEGDTPPEVKMVVDSNYPVTIKGNIITLDVSKISVGYLKVDIIGGAFFDTAQRKEHPEFEYVIHTL